MCHRPSRKKTKLPIEEDPFAGLKNVTFEQKLKRSSDDLKQNYQEIRDYVLSYGTPIGFLGNTMPIIKV
jgi:hypothetical protein